jgi:cleavage stimulation factor subunit 3
VYRAKPLFLYFHDYESQFGEQAQITKLEQRMATLFTEDPTLQRFASRFANQSFDPTAQRPVISPRSQMRPVMPAGVMPTVEEPQQPMPMHNPVPQERVASPAILNSPRMNHLMPAIQSPKRPLEDADNDQPRKMVRGESPLKGAAGRRLDAARRNNQMAGGNTPVAGPTPLPRMVNFMLTIIPPAHTYGDMARFSPEGMVQLLRNTNIPLPQGMGVNTQQPMSSGPPSTHINSQLQNIHARFGQGPGYM